LRNPTSCAEEDSVSIDRVDPEATSLDVGVITGEAGGEYMNPTSTTSSSRKHPATLEFEYLTGDAGGE
jgi:hypothetical protein